MTLGDIDFCNVWARVVHLPVQEPCRSACVVRRRCAVKLSLVPARSAPSMRPLCFGAVPASSLRSLCGVAGGTVCSTCRSLGRTLRLSAATSWSSNSVRFGGKGSRWTYSRCTWLVKISFCQHFARLFLFTVHLAGEHVVCVSSHTISLPNNRDK